MNEYYIIVPNEVIQAPEVSGYDLAVYIYLRALSVNVFGDELVLTPYTIGTCLGQTFDSHFIAKVKTSLLKLAKLYPNDIQKAGQGFIFTATAAQKEYNIFMTIDELRQILNGHDVNKYNALKVYLIILSARTSKIVVEKQKYIVTNMPMSWYEEHASMTRQSLNKYLTTLETNQMLYIMRGQHKNNLIGKYQHKALIQQYGVQNGYKCAEPQQTNQKRSLMQKYHHLIKMVEQKQSIPYTNEELYEIRNYILERNRVIDKYQGLDPSFNGTRYNAEVILDIIKCKGVSS